MVFSSRSCWEAEAVPCGSAASRAVEEMPVGEQQRRAARQRGAAFGRIRVVARAFDLDVAQSSGTAEENCHFNGDPAAGSMRRRRYFSHRLQPDVGAFRTAGQLAARKVLHRGRSAEERPSGPEDRRRMRCCMLASRMSSQQERQDLGRTPEFTTTSPAAAAPRITSAKKTHRQEVFIFEPARRGAAAIPEGRPRTAGHGSPRRRWPQRAVRYVLDVNASTRTLYLNDGARTITRR